MAYDGTRPRDDDFVKESAGIIRQNFEGLRIGGLVAPRPPLYGAGAPAATLGEAFDRYINTSTGDEYYKSSASAWVRVLDLGAIYKNSAGVYYTSAATPDSSVGVVGDVCFSEGSLAQRVYVKEPSGWVQKTLIPKGSEKYQDMGSISGTKNINAVSGTIVKFTVAAALTITLTAAVETGLGCTLTLLMTKGGAYTVTWPTSVAWSGGITPTFSSTATDVVTLTTINGSDWVGTMAGATPEEEKEVYVAPTIYTLSGGASSFSTVRYYKDANNNVFVWLNKNAGTVFSAGTIRTLPSGFRPKTAVSIYGVYGVTTMPYTISTAGVIASTTSLESNVAVCAWLIFPAA